MRYNEWNPTIHTTQDAPEVALTHAWNRYYKAHKALPTRIDADQDLFDAFAKKAKQVDVSIDAKPTEGIKTAKMYSTGQPGWEYTFSGE